MMCHRRNSLFKFLHPKYHALSGMLVDVPAHALAEAKALARIVSVVSSVEYYNAPVAARIAVVAAMQVNATMDQALLAARFHNPPATPPEVVAAHLTNTLDAYVAASAEGN